MTMEMREQILQLSQDIIQREGIDALSFRIVAEKVGIKSASVHYHFPKKDDLIFELAERYLVQFETSLADVYARGTTARQRVRGLTALFRSTEKQDKFCLCGRLAAINTRLDERSRAAARRFFAMLRDWVHSVLKEGAAAGEFEGVIGHKVLATTIVSTLEGALLIDHMHDSGEHLAAASKLIDVLLKG